jgi:hypothetical protein
MNEPAPAPQPAHHDPELEDQDATYPDEEPEIQNDDVPHPNRAAPPRKTIRRPIVKRRFVEED